MKEEEVISFKQKSGGLNFVEYLSDVKQNDRAVKLFLKSIGYGLSHIVYLINSEEFIMELKLGMGYNVFDIMGTHLNIKIQ